MGAIGLNPIRLDRIGLDPIRINAIKLGVPGASSDRPYIDPEVLASLKAVCICYGKSNDDPDRAVVKNLVDPDNPFVISNAAYTEGSGYADKDSPYYGAFVTDGIDDLITSTKTVQEMLGGSNEITVMSMYHTISENTDVGGVIANSLVYSDSCSVFNITQSDDCICGYGLNLDNYNLQLINNILGDKDKISAESELNSDISYSKFNVVGGGEEFYGWTSSIAWYWTVIANKVLTTDQINQVIAYFNLDRTLKPDILCNTIKQGITNENHAEFGDKLIDYSGNGRDILLNNIAWKGGSGIAAKPFETIKDYLIVPDEGLQELTIYNEFSYKVKSIKYADRYWIVQSVNKTDTSYPVTIITDKDIVWRNALNYTDADGVKGSVRKETNVPANTPTQVFIYGFNDFDISDDYTKVNCVAYATRKDITEFTVTFIPSYKGGLLLDGIADFGKVTGMPIYKDYTFIIDYERISYTSEGWGGAIVSKSPSANNGAFISMMANSAGTNKQLFSFGGVTAFIKDDLSRILFWQTKYKSENTELTVGEGVDGDTLWLGTLRDNDSRFFNGAIYSLMSFPYSMSEFLIERQLKKHKLGTLYPDMVEWRPIYTSNVNDYTVTKTSYFNEGGQRDLSLGSYYPISTRIRIYVKPNGAADEVTSIKVNGVELTYDYVDSDYGYAFNGTLSDKSPQKIDITIDEYIRYEDIDFTNCYPGVPRIYVNDKSVTWGDKLKVGDEFTFYGNVNILPEMYNVLVKALYNGKEMVYGSIGTISKSMAFTSFKTYIFDDNEPKVILSPRLLSIPNSSYKILGYIPDISGHGNNGVIYNSAYAEGSGVNEDGSYQFDGVDDFVTIPTLSSGGKQVLMKVNSFKTNNVIYDQRNINNRDSTFCIVGDTSIAYITGNAGNTYIDGILNQNITGNSLINITHNITITNKYVTTSNSGIPNIGSQMEQEAFGKMSLYDFMLFDEISTDDKIQELNEYVGVEAKVEKPDYYWDAYGKTNSDEDKATIQQRGVAVGDYDLTNYNHAYDKMSGYDGYEFAKFDNTTEWELFSSDSIDIISRNGYSITLRTKGGEAFWGFRNIQTKGFQSDDIPFKVRANKSVIIMWDVYGNAISDGQFFGRTIMSTTLNPDQDATISLKHMTEEELNELGMNKDGMYYGIWFDLSTLAIDEEVTIEMLPLYPNGLVYDGVEDFSVNKNVPIIDDFTVIAKRTWLEENISDKPFVIKGDTLYPDGNQNAFLFEYGKLSTYSFGQNNKYDESVVPSLISWATPTSYNGTTSLVRGSAIDTVGIDIAHATKMVFYKLILYPKTISLLEINFLKNLMEKDEIIDLNNPIFIQE